MLRGERESTCKMNRDKQGGSGSKIRSLSEHSFRMSFFVATKIYDMLIFNLTNSLIRYNLSSDTNYTEWPFLRIILNFYKATHTSLIQSESYQQSPEKNDSGINKVLMKWKSMVNTRDNINTWVHSLCYKLIYIG